MSSSVSEIIFSGDGVSTRGYHEFDTETDGPSLSQAMLDEHGTRAASIDEMLYMTIIAATKDDRTTINALACLRKYWRKYPEASK